MDKAKHSLILLFFNNRDLIKDRLSEVEKLYGPEDSIEVVIMDNGSEDRLAMLEIAVWKPDLKFKKVRLAENVGFGQGFNRAVEESSGWIIHLISSDVRLYGRTIEAVEDALEKQPNALIGAEMIDRDAGWNRFGDDPPIKYLSGFYLATRRITWDRLGGFDKRFFPYDYEDIDLSYRFSKNGLPLVQIDLPVHHEAAGTIGFTKERFEHTINMRAEFADKWFLSNIPRRP